MAEFSLIIPVYNAQEFLAECLDSCINQTFKDIEIICINNGSIDDSYKILEHYIQKDYRIKVIAYKQNRGPGGARNAGVAAATGKYCWFIDSDDSILLNACEILHNIFTKTVVDIVRFSWINYYYDIPSKTRNIVEGESCSWPHDTLLTKQDFTRLDIPAVQPWAYVTVSSLLKSRKFRENGLHDDIEFTSILFAESNSIYCVNCTLYFYKRHRKSITKGNSNDIDQKHTIDILLSVDALCDYIIHSDLPNNHFCIQTLLHFHTLSKERYKVFSEIHTEKLDGIIKKGDKIIECFCKKFKGDTKLYNNIITEYGNTQLLEFILRAYRFIIHRIKNKFK
ncbi:hypothetical protein FACS189445_5630 [Spirochaetia bacterium]|nr:hypothetical protein FACS189445_5630 [Spirochaetia bacterium]